MMLRVQRITRFWDSSQNAYRSSYNHHESDVWLACAGDEVAIDIPDGRVVFRWIDQASLTSDGQPLIYASLTYQPVRRGLLRPSRRR